MELKIFLYNWTPLICAAQKKRRDVIKLLLLQPGIELNCKHI